MAAVHESKNSNSAPQQVKTSLESVTDAHRESLLSQWQVVLAPIVAWTDRFGLAGMESYRSRKSNLVVLTILTKLPGFGMFLPLFDEIS